MRKKYHSPAILTIAIHQQHMLAGSNTHQGGGPSATFMSNPDIGDEDNAGSRKNYGYDEDEDEEMD